MQSQEDMKATAHPPEEQKLSWWKLSKNLLVHWEEELFTSRAWSKGINYIWKTQKQ